MTGWCSESPAFGKLQTVTCNAKKEMLQLLDRKKILDLNKTFASVIISVQDVTYNPIHKLNINTPGEMYLGDSESPRFVDQDECDKMNFEAQQEFENRRDKIEVVSVKDKFCGFHVFTLRPKNIVEYLYKLTSDIEVITNQLQWDKILFLMDYDTPWLYQENDYPSVKSALNHLKDIGVSPKFNGGFLANGKELVDLFKSIFWIARCNASLPYTYFAGEKSNVIGSICDEGNLHMDFYNQVEMNKFIEVTGKLGWTIVKDGNCNNKFDDYNIFEGQEMRIK